MQSRPKYAAAVALATPCWPAPVSAITRVLPIRRVSSAWPSTLRILCAPVWLRSSRLSSTRQPDRGAEPLGEVERAGHAGVLAQDRVELGHERRVGHRLLPGDGQLVERRDQRLGHEPAAEVAEEPRARRRRTARRCGHASIPVISATARAGSPSRTSASPTRTAWAPSATYRFTSSRRGDAGLGHQHPVVRDQRREPAEGVRVDLEGLQVAGVDPDQLGAQRHGPLGLGLVVHLDQHGHAELAGLVVERPQRGVVERGHDQQHQVGAGRAGLEHLVGIDQEVLAQQRYVDGGPHRAEVVEAAAEPALLGEHADRGGPAGGVLPRQGGRVGDLGEVALAGAAPLHLGDHAGAGRAQPRHRVPGRVDVGERGPQVRLGHGPSAGRRGRSARRRRCRRARTCEILQNWHGQGRSKSLIAAVGSCPPGR